MSSDEQRIAIAEACGWVREYADVQTWNAGLNSYKGGYEPIRTMLFRRKEKCFRAENLPDYLADLNAMHEAEIFIRKDHDVYGLYLQHLNRTAPECRVHASAEQKAEAFLRAIGKWEEGK